jgi:hypothetical protein
MHWGGSRVAAHEFEKIDAYSCALTRRDRVKDKKAAWLQEAIEISLASRINARQSGRSFKHIRTYLFRNTIS